MRALSLPQKYFPVCSIILLLVIGFLCNLWVFYADFDLSPLEGPPLLRDNVAVTTSSSTDGPKNLEIMESLERPLFSPTRKMFRPPEIPIPSGNELPEQTAPLDITPPALRLHGTRELSGVRAGLVSLGPAESEEWIVQGSAIGGWSVSEITRDTLTLSHESQIKTYSLFDQSMEP